MDTFEINKIVPYNSLGRLVDIHTLKDLKLAEQIMKIKL